MTSNSLDFSSAKIFVLAAMLFSLMFLGTYLTYLTEVEKEKTKQLQIELEIKKIDTSKKGN
jgi:uncharacterized membrane protein YozB (DUF420 family)